MNSNQQQGSWQQDDQPHGNQQHGEKPHDGQHQASASHGGPKLDVDTRRVLPGIILIGVGLLALFSSLDLDSWLSRLILAALFAAAAYFAYLASERHKRPLLKWAAASLAILAVAVLISGGVGEALLVGVFALAFYFVWQRDKQRWWALIPAGALATIAVTQLLEVMFGSIPEGLFLIGLAVTFYALTRLEVKPQGWAIFPAAALAVVAALNIVSATGWFGPLLLIGIGVLLLVRSGALKGLTGIGKPRVRAEPQVAPAEPAYPVEPSQRSTAAPAPQAKSPDAAMPSTERPSTENPGVEKPDTTVPGALDPNADPDV